MTPTLIVPRRLTETFSMKLKVRKRKSCGVFSYNIEWGFGRISGRTDELENYKMPISKSVLKKAAAKAWADCFKENEATGERTLRIYGDDALIDNYLAELGEDYDFVNPTGLRCQVANVSANTFRFSITLVDVEYDDIKTDVVFHDELDEDEEDYIIALGIETVDDDCSDSCDCAEEEAFPVTKLDHYIEYRKTAGAEALSYSEWSRMHYTPIEPASVMAL